MASAGEIRDLLDERPDLEPAIETVLRPEPPFTFDDVAVDSGAFGELVARGVVERAGDGYRVADPGAVRRGLAGETPEERADPRDLVSLPTLPVSRLELALVGGAIALVVAFRLIPLPNVYHGGHVVLSSNDPYLYRYLVEQLLTDPEVTPANLEGGISRGEPLLVTTLWLITLALGGTTEAAGHVLAWYPVASAAITSVFVYALAVVVADDRRIGLASVAMFAVIPAHAVRTSLGFADHHAFDYVWLALTLLGIVVVVRGARRNRGLLSGTTAGAVVVIAIGVVGQTLAWDNSPIILAAIGGYIVLEGLRSVHVDARPARTLGPVVTGVGVGAVVTWIAHTRLGWHTVLVASAPVLLTFGGIGVLIGAELMERLDLRTTREGTDASAAVLAALEAVGLVGAAVALWTLRPAYWEALTTNLRGRLLTPRSIAEVLGLFGEGQDWLLLLGFALFIGVPYLVWASVYVLKDGRWLPPVSFAWYFLALSVIQVRFVGELAPVFAVFLGIGLVHLAERIDVACRPAPFSADNYPGISLPSSRQFSALTMLFLLVGSLGMVQVFTETSQVTSNPARSDAAIWMAEYSEEHDMAYPSNYVFSEWGRNRMYNYFVSGESHSYSFAQSNFEAFIRSTDPAIWYDRLGDRRGFVVTTSADIGGPRQLGTRLHRHDGAGTQTTPALARYRLVHVTGDGSFKVFTVVPGAVIEGTSEPNATISARTEVRVGDRSFPYVRRTTANASGGYQLRVAHPGQYRVADVAIDVNESAVNEGMTVQVK